MTEKELEAYLPFTAVQDDCILSRRGDITFGWRLLHPVAFSVNEAGYDSMIMSFAQAYRLLPEWCVVHKQDVYSYESYVPQGQGEFLIDSYEEHFRGRKYLCGHSYIYLTFSSRANIENGNRNSGFLGFLDRKVPRAEDMARCADIASQFGAVLGSNPLLVVRRLTTDDLLRMDERGRDQGVLPDFLRMYSEGMDYNLHFGNDSIEYGGEQMKVWYVEDSDAYPSEVSSVTHVGSMSSGSSSVFLSGGAPIGYSLDIPHVVNRYILTVPRKTVEAELDQKKRTMTSFSLYSAECAVNSDELREYLLEAARTSTVTVKGFMDLMAWGRPEDMAGIRNRVLTAFSEMNVSVTEETDIAPLLHYAAIPGAAAELGYENYIRSELMAFLCHGLWDGYDRGMKGGLVKVCDRNMLVPVSIDMQSAAREKGLVENMNMLVVGPSGSGKSFTMDHLVLNWYVSGQHIFIIDVGDSYQGLCQVIREETGGKDGIYNTYDPDHPFCFNPFRGHRMWNDASVDEDGVRKDSGKDFIGSLLKTIYTPDGGWSKDGWSVMEHVLKEFLAFWDGARVPDEMEDSVLMAYLLACEEKSKKAHRKFDKEKAARMWQNPFGSIFREGRGEDPLFDDFYQYVTLVVAPLINSSAYMMGNVEVKPYMFDANRFGAAMDLYKKGGTYGFLLNAEEEADLFSSRLTVFEVDTIKDNRELFPLWVLCIMHSFEDKMRALPCQKVMVIEEAWKAISMESMREFIIWLWRTARKFRTSACVVTQALADLTGNDVIENAIIQNTSVKIMLDQSRNANSFSFVAGKLGFSPMAVSLALSVNRNLRPGYRYKEAFFAIGERYCNVFGIEVSDEMQIAFETDKTLKKPVFDRAEKCGSLIQAIREMANERRRARQEGHAV